MCSKIKIFVSLSLLLLLLGGCKRYISPLPGYLASEESRIALADEEISSGIFKTGEMQFDYQINRRDDGVGISGDISFYSSLTYSYPNIRTFIMKLSWLDANGQVIGVSDISPFYKYLGMVPEKLKINKKLEAAEGSSAMAFSYYGVFQGQKPDISDEWTISHFPFTE